MAMDDEVPGAVGTSASFALRLGQTIFSAASLLFMSLGVEFHNYTAFCFLVTIMGLVIPWSITLALIDIYSVLIHCPIRQPGILLFIVLGDWVSLALEPVRGYRFKVKGSKIPLYFTKEFRSVGHPTLTNDSFLFSEVYNKQALSFLTLAAASSIAGIVDLFQRADVTFCPAGLCSRYQISAALAFLSWFLSTASSLSNLWLLPSLSR